MHNEDLLYVEDAKKRKLFYRFTPAAIASNFVPLIVILDDEGKAQERHFEHKMWNVLTPLDNFGYENKGSCWLGEKGDFFVKDLLQHLIHEIAEEYECEDHIYMYGSSMGGYGAILHGILCKANAVYAHAPYIRLQETNNANTAQKNFYDSIFNESISKENDLTNFLNPIDAFPIFYLCDDGTADENCLEDEMTYFLDACKKNDIKVDLDHCAKLGNDGTQTVKEVLNFFERMASGA
ncbi:alpha/beta hydrolase family protein [Sulfurovum sp.]|uniref:alpha/beta hydrolase family protein n=1 Tax=Sulfurovum sp. TaxID=1969726 RepID=UPI00356831AE